MSTYPGHVIGVAHLDFESNQSAPLRYFSVCKLNCRSREFLYQLSVFRYNLNAKLELNYDEFVDILRDFYHRVSIASYANRWYSQRRHVRPSVCPSVRLSHSGIVSKRRKLES